MRLNIKRCIAIFLSIIVASSNMMIKVSAEENQEINIVEEINNDQLNIDYIDEDLEENEFYSIDSEPSDDLSESNFNVKISKSPNCVGIGKVKSANVLNVRSGPSTSYRILSTLKEGDTVEIYSKFNGWYRILIDGKIGYVSGKYIYLLPIENGIDVSKWNSERINWNKVKASGIDYVIIRAGYGSSNVDETFKINIEGAIKAGLKIGIY